MPEERVHERINNILGTVGVLGKYQLVVFTWTFFVGSISQTIDVIIPFAQADMDFRSVKHQHDSRSRDQSLSQSQAILQVQSTGSVANKWFKKCSTIWFKIWSMSLYFEYNTLVLIRGFFYVVAWQGQQITLSCCFFWGLRTSPWWKSDDHSLQLQSAEWYVFTKKNLSWSMDWDEYKTTW